MSARILLVDDDPNILDTARDILEDAGYTVETAGTMAAAVQMLQGAAFDLMLVDYNLPEGSGVTLARQARALQAEIVVILMTGEAHIHIDPSAPVHDYLVKPVNPPELLNILKKALAGK